jgi:formylglycine-generating enzyme required for sulfatase activity
MLGGAAPATTIPTSVGVQQQPRQGFPIVPVLGGLGAVVVCAVVAAVLVLPRVLGGGGAATSSPGATATSAVIVAEISPTTPPTEAPPTDTVAAPTEPPRPTETAAPPTFVPGPTGTPPAAPTPTLPPIPEGMVFIPGGAFKMGSETGQADEKPEHDVTLEAFLIDKYEVTNARYQACVDAGACVPPRSRSSFTRGAYFGNPDFANYPVVFVNWEQADAFCAWEGKRLPTEAEWEFVASGGDDRIFPWGNDWDPLLVPNDDTVEVGSLEGNQSPFGVYDLAGNALEWVADHYGPYSAEAIENPTGPEDGTTKVRRGGSFGRSNRTNYTTTRRYRERPGFSVEDVGFRCAADAP